MFSLMPRRPAREERAVARRHDPFWELREEMDNMFERFFEDRRLPREWAETREWNVEETENEIVMRLELPGFETKEIEVRVEGNNFVVRAEHPEREGRAAERFEYRFVLPFGTDAAHVEAAHRNGVLELHLPRLPEARPRRIEVKT